MVRPLSLLVAMSAGLSAVSGASIPSSETEQHEVLFRAEVSTEIVSRQDAYLEDDSVAIEISQDEATFIDDVVYELDGEAIVEYDDPDIDTDTDMTPAPDGIFSRQGKIHTGTGNDWCNKVGAGPIKGNKPLWADCKKIHNWLSKESNRKMIGWWSMPKQFPVRYNLISYNTCALTVSMDAPGLVFGSKDAFGIMNTAVKNFKAGSKQTPIQSNYPNFMCTTHDRTGFLWGIWRVEWNQGAKVNSVQYMAPR